MGGKYWALSAEQFRPRPFSGRKALEKAQSNMKINSEAFGRRRGLLHGQKTQPLCDMYYGKYSLGWNGCEIIAAANVMEMCGLPQYFPQVIFEFELNRMHYIFPSGYWGTSPKRLGRFFSAHGLSFKRIFPKKEFVQNSAGGKHSCGIVSFWNNKKSDHGADFFSGGLHTVAYRYDNGKYLVYNLYGRDTSPREVESIAEVFSDRRFIVGYVF